MAYIYSQTSYDSDNRLTFGPTEGESINQSLIFSRRFQLNAINLLFDHITISPSEDLQFRIEVRNSSGSSDFLDLDIDPVRTSSWIRDNDLSSFSYVQFVFDRTELPAGIYYFSLVSNIRIRYPIYLALKTNGYFRGYFIKIEGGTGIYRSDWSLALKVDGVWGAAPKPISVYERSIYLESTLRDES